MIFNDSKFNSHWAIRRLSDLGSFKRGKSKHRPRNDPALFYDGKYPFVQTGEIKAANLYIRNHSVEYGEFGLKQSELWPENTLCITIAANIAETALLGYPMCFPDSVVGYNANPNESSELFMHYVFTFIKKAIQNSATGSIQDNINIDYLTGLKFRIPEKAYQDKVVGVLAAIDQKIELNNKINAELEAMAKTLYDYWFVQFDFPDENGKPYKSSGGKMAWNNLLKSQIPEKWTAIQLKNLLINCSNPIDAAKINKALPYTPIDSLPMKKMSFGSFHPSDEAKTSLIKYEKNDILIGAMRVYFHRVCIAPFDGITRTTTLVLRPRKMSHMPYLYQVCNETRTITAANKLSNGTQQPYVNWEKALEDHFVNYPEDETLIEKYSSIMSGIVKNVINREKENTELIKMRDWLLPLLMNGQVKVL